MIFRRRMVAILDHGYATGRLSQHDYAAAIAQLRDRRKLDEVHSRVSAMVSRDLRLTRFEAVDFEAGPILQWLQDHWLDILQAIAAILSIAVLFVAVKQPSLSPTATGLLSAAVVFEGAHCCDGPPHPLLMDLAADHADYQARACVQGHQHFNSRYERVAAELGGIATEICAESWDRQRDDNLYALGLEMFTCWKQSPGHWSVASREHRFWGGSMALGVDGIWYACILVDD